LNVLQLQFFLISEPECKDGYCPPIYKSYLELADDSNPNAVGEQILYMAVDSILYFGLIMLADYGVFEKLYDMMMKTAIGIEIDVQQLEDDVLTEKERVNSKIGGTVVLIFSSFQSTRTFTLMCDKYISLNKNKINISIILTQHFHPPLSELQMLYMYGYSLHILPFTVSCRICFIFCVLLCQKIQRVKEL
jgi:hypothetical protein